LRKALQIVKNVYSIHKLSKATKGKIEKVCEGFKAKIELEKSLDISFLGKEENRL